MASTSLIMADNDDVDVIMCGICWDPIDDPYTLPSCSHTFCRGCIKQHQEMGLNNACPYCRAHLPPGLKSSIDQCCELTLEIAHCKREGRTSEVEAAQRLQLQHARNAVEADPRHAIARGFLANGLYLVNKDYGGAEREYRKAIALDTDADTSLAHSNLGCLLCNVHQDFDGAEGAFRAAVKYNPDHALAHFNLGALLLNVRRDFDGAEREMRETIRCDPDIAKAHFKLGNLLYNVRMDYAGVAREMRETIRCEPDHVLAHFNLGTLLLNVMQDLHGAEREFIEVLRLSPKSTSARKAFASLRVIYLKRDGK
jgi:Flp pilus assembly protein TadD